MHFKLLLIPMIALLSSCAMNIDAVTPDADIAGLKKSSEDLGVWIDQSIPSKFEVNSGQLKTAYFDNYRVSLENAFGATFTKYFKGVYFAEEVPAKGTFIHLFKAAPKHVVRGTSGQINWTGSYSESLPMVAMQVAWYAEIFRDGKKIKDFEGKVLSDERASGVDGAEEITSDALRLMMEQFGSEIRAISNNEHNFTKTAAN